MSDHSQQPLADAGRTQVFGRAADVQGGVVELPQTMRNTCVPASWV